MEFISPFFTHFSALAATPLQSRVRRARNAAEPGRVQGLPMVRYIYNFTLKKYEIMST
jgi:hypothetical protein